MSTPRNAPLPSKLESVATLPFIAIVDDDKSFREAMAHVIRSLGYSVAAFASGEDFLLSPCIDETDCLICDVRMPRMSGMELQKELVARDLRIPIIFVTAHPTEGTRESALAAGALGVLSKPCNMDTLTSLLNQALKGRHATR